MKPKRDAMAIAGNSIRSKINSKLIRLSARKCPKDKFACDDGAQCIEKSSACDNRIDCGDGSDEKAEVCQGLKDCTIFFYFI